VYILHVAPFDASRYPPLINAVHVSAAAGVPSVIIASAPVPAPQVFGSARLVAVDHPVGGAGQYAYLMRQTRAIVREERPALIIAHNVRGLSAVAMVNPPGGAPFIYHCHDFEDDGDLRSRVLHLGEMVASRRAAEIWVPAIERMALARKRHLPAHPLLVQNCPRRLPSLPTRGRLRAWLREQRATLGEPRIIIRHGRIGAAHCILETIEAMPLLPRDVVFVIVGDGDKAYVRDCLATAARLGIEERLFFHPFVPHSELMELLVDANVAMCLYAPLDINASIPAPNKVFESMAVGLPVVVATGNSVSTDVLDADAGLSVPVGSREALASALGRLIEDDAFAARTGRAGREAHLGRFNYETQLQHTRLGSLLSANPPVRAPDRVR
jgi:glycosyltransferase involved in cell wall biosynthesis